MEKCLQQMYTAKKFPEVYKQTLECNALEAQELINDGCDMCTQHMVQKFRCDNKMRRLYIENNAGSYEKILQ